MLPSHLGRAGARRGLALLVLAGTIGFLDARASAQEQPRVAANADGDEEVLAWDEVLRLLHLTRDKNAPPLEELAPLLAPHLQRELPRVLGILFDRRTPPLGDTKELPLSKAQEMLIETALEEIERAEVTRALDAFVAGRDGLTCRRLRIEVEGCVGSSTELEGVFQCALHEAEEDEVPVPLNEVLRPALRKIMLRDPKGTTEWLLRGWRSLSPALPETIVLALGDADDARALPVLLSIAELRRDLAIAAVSQVRSIGPSPDAELNARWIDLVHSLVDLQRAGRCQTLVLALGELGDYESVPFLIELLEGEHDGLAESALWSLRRLSSLKLPASAALWNHWYERELVWASRERPKLIECLESGPRVEAVAAAKEIAEHRYERHVLAEALAGALERTDPEIRLAACRGLPALASPNAQPALLVARDDPDPRVAAAAAAALAETKLAEDAPDRLVADDAR